METSPDGEIGRRQWLSPARAGTGVERRRCQTREHDRTGSAARCPKTGRFSAGKMWAASGPNPPPAISNP